MSSNSYSPDGNNFFTQQTILPNGFKTDSKGNPTDEKYPDLQGAYSMFNSVSVIHYNSFENKNSDGTVEPFTREDVYFDGNGVAKGLRNPTGTNIVKTFYEGGPYNNMAYRYNDFLFLKYYKKIPNNHLITLRRFPNPVRDDITSRIVAPDPDVSRLLTYIDGETNTFDSVFTFSCGFNWKEFESEIQTLERSKTGWSALDKLTGYADTSGTYVRDNTKSEAERNFDPYTTHRDNYVWGPIDVIDKVMTRDKGLKFDQDLTLTFPFEVKSYAGINTRVAFLDMLGNILNMVTNKAPFWGGQIRLTGTGGYSGPLGDAKLLKQGDMLGFIGSFLGDLGSKLTEPFNEGFVEGAKTIATNVGASIFGGKLTDLGKPETFSLFSLLSGDATGEWHLTVGNPFNPTMMIGNLILEDATIKLDGPMTVDDVPSQNILEVKLKHAMARDKYAIQTMFNYGAGRYYGADLDFEEKSYYRNRTFGGKKGKAPTTPDYRDLNEKTGEGQVRYASNVATQKYNSVKSAVKIA
jgi:hypothetical protein